MEHVTRLEFAQEANVEGDENVGYFHGILNHKRRKITIRSIMLDMEWVDEMGQVEEEFRVVLLFVVF